MRFFSLKEWPTDVREGKAYVDPIFATIATKYDFMTRALSLGQERRWKRKAISLIPKDTHARRIIDLATGTGDFPILLHMAGFRSKLIGLDRNPKMLAVAAEKCARLQQVNLILGDLMHIPFKGNSFDVVTMGYGLRYVADIRQTVEEVFRLLRSGGMFLCLDFGLPKNRFYRQVCFAYLLLLGSLWGLILHRNAKTYWHIVESLRAYPGQERVGKWLEETGFREIKLREKLGGMLVILSGVRP